MPYPSRPRDACWWRLSLQCALDRLKLRLRRLQLTVERRSPVSAHTREGCEGSGEYKQQPLLMPYLFRSWSLRRSSSSMLSTDGGCCMTTKHEQRHE